MGQREAEAARLAEEQMKIAADAQAEQEKLEQRLQELRQVEAEQEANARRRAEEEAKHVKELMELKNSLSAEREELQRQQAEQKEAAEKVAAASAARAAEILAQEAEIAKQKLEVEKCRLTDEAERAAKLEELKVRQQEVERQREEAEAQRKQEEENRQIQEQNLFLMQEELRGRAEQLHDSETALLREQRGLTDARGQLAMVQAHVMNMIDKTSGKAEVATHNLSSVIETGDDLAEPEEELQGNEDQDVLDMDWSAAVMTTVHDASPVRKAAAAPSEVAAVDIDGPLETADP